MKSKILALTLMVVLVSGLWLARVGGVRCSNPVWLGGNPVQTAHAGIGPYGSVSIDDLHSSIRAVTAHGQPFSVESILDDDPTYGLTLEFSTQRSSLTVARYGWVVCPFVVDLGGEPVGN